MLRWLPFALVCVWQISLGDTIELRSGGVLQGKVLNVEDDPRTTYRVRLNSGGNVTIDVQDVATIKQHSPEQQRYQELLEQMPADTAELHWKMAEQCKRWSLPRERTFHLEQTIRLDPNHEQARRALKYKLQEDGSWARVEEIKAEQGFVRRKGKWVSKQDAKLLDQQEAQRDAEIAWQKKLKMWRGWMSGRRQRTAIRAIESIDDPLAAGPLVMMFWEESNVAFRELIAEVLGRLNSSVATRALWEAAMRGDTEQENEIRLFAVEQLEKNDRRGVVPNFVGQLASNQNVRIRRAGYALSVLGDESVVLPLIRALRTKHARYVGGQGNGGINAGRGGLSVGRSKPKRVDEYRNNKEVLNALVRLTDQDFGYDQSRWLNWYLTQTTPPNLDLRRDP